jgi:hypothetical protein
MSAGPSSGIVAQSALVEIDLYTPDVTCDGNLVTAGAAPVSSQTFAQGQPISLSVPPGQYTIGMRVWSDAAGTQQIGGGCVAATSLLPDQQVCIDVVVIEVDASAIVGCTSDNQCPFDQYCGTDGKCAPGCKSSVECSELASNADGGADGGAGSNKKICNTTSHSCVGCVVNTDCPLGDVCTPAGTCAIGCDPSHGCPSGLTCCSSICVDTKNDLNNCNTCGNICTGGPNTVVGCSASACTVACKPGYGDCDGNTANGCETNLNAPATCGPTCGAKINCATAVQNATNIGCSGGTCTFSCSPGFGNCDGNPSNGCETNMDTSTSCGLTCGSQVNCTATVKNAINIGCAAGQCTFTCSAPYGDCDGNKSNGCESNTSTDSMNCGLCGRPCNVANVASLTCAGGLCTSTCNTGWSNCAEPAAPNADDGCETNTSSDPMNCGGCGKVCNLPNTSTYQCMSSTCGTQTCSAGYVDCNGAFGADGCECQTGAPNSGLCCGTGCQTKHLNGDGTHNTGQNYFDCYPLGIPGSETAKSGGGFDPTVPTNSPVQMALDARSVFMYPANSGATNDSNVACAGTGINNCVRRWYNDSAGTTHCITWCYADDPTAMVADSKGFIQPPSQCQGLLLSSVTQCGVGGHFYDSTMKGGPNGAVCFCPWPTDPQWN